MKNLLKKLETGLFILMCAGTVYTIVPKDYKKLGMLSYIGAGVSLASLTGLVLIAKAQRKNLLDLDIYKDSNYNSRENLIDYKNDSGDKK